MALQIWFPSVSGQDTETMMEVMETSEELDAAQTQDEVDRIRKRNRSKARLRQGIDGSPMKNGDFP